tara:strand:+ start:7735 stop:8298 length:564 start_codon:yes stop_codon:yes gene_type:complete
MKINDKVREVLKPFEVKKVVVGRGHDCGGLICDLYFNKKKVLQYHDDGWGGESEQIFLSDKVEKLVLDYLTENNYKQIMFDNGWDFLEDVDKIKFHSMVGNVVESLVTIKEELKFEKKIKNACKKGVVFGSKTEFRTFAWKGIKTLEQLTTMKGGVGALQNAYYNAKKEDGVIFNDLGRLKNLGVNV